MKCGVFKWNEQTTLFFRCNSLEKIDFILYRHTSGVFLLFDFHKHLVFNQVSKTKADSSVTKYSQSKCKEEKTVHHSLTKPKK